MVIIFTPLRTRDFYFYSKSVILRVDFSSYNSVSYESLLISESLWETVEMITAQTRLYCFEKDGLNLYVFVY